MTQSNSNSNAATFGFITVVELASIGHCGGLLIVSQIGRPIEFHCTAPVGLNRAQEIMYGKTYNGFLFSDQIGMALMDKAKHQPTTFVTDCPDLLPTTELMDTPLVLAENIDAEIPFDGSGLDSFILKEQTLYCMNADREELPHIRSAIVSFSRTLPIDEPFERIRQAIEEAHTCVRAA